MTDRRVTVEETSNTPLIAHFARQADETFLLPGADADVRLKVRIWGSSEPTFVFVHGFAEGGYVWEGLAQAIAGGGKAIVLDLRGHGDSDWDRHKRYHLERYVADVATVLQKLGLSQCTLVGHSMGGGVTARVGSLLNGLVEAMVLVDYAPEVAKRGADFVNWEFTSSEKTYASSDEYFDWLRATRHLAKADRLRQIANNALRSRADGQLELKRDPALIQRHDKRSDETLDAWAALRSIRCPVLLVRGAGSSMVSSAMAGRIAEHVPNCQVQTIPMAGHGVMTDNPDAFVSCVRRFVAHRALGARSVIGFG